MDKEPIPMPTSNRIVQILTKKKQLYAIDPDELHVIKRLRSLTGAGIADTRKALRDNDYNFDKALARLKELVRKPAILTNVKLQEGK